MSDVQIAIIDQENIEVNLAVPGIQGAKGDTGTVAAAGDGTNLLPGIAFAADLNTGIYRPGADQLAISTGGTGRLFVDGDGDIQVGSASTLNAGIISVTANPASKNLYVAFNGTTTGADFLMGGISANANGTNIGAIDIYRGSSDDHGYISFRTKNGTTLGERARIRADGMFEVKGAGVAGSSPAFSVSGSAPGNSVLIDSNGRLGIGTTSPTQKVQITDGSLSNFYIAPGYNSGTGTLLATGGSEYLAFATNGLTNERARIDASGRLLVGTSTYVQTNTYTSSNRFNIAGNSGVGPQLSTYSDDAFALGIDFSKSRGATVGTQTSVSNGDALGSLIFNGYDSAAYKQAASIQAAVDGAPGSTIMPGRLVFSTNSGTAGAGTTERMRITSAGVLQVADAGNIAVGTTTGTKIGTATTQKLGFYNATPVVQPAAVADATDAASVITQLNALLARMRSLGLIAT